MSRFKSFFQIAHLTCLEIPRQPALLLLTTTLLLFMGSLPFLITHNLGETGKLVRDSALALMFLGSILLAVPASCHAISSEIRRGTAGAILSKPVSRIQFLFAKFIGVSIVMLAFCGMSILTILIADRAASVENRMAMHLLHPIFIAILSAYLIASVLNYKRQTPFSAAAFWTMAITLILGFAWSALLPTSPDIVAFKWAILPAGVLLALAALMIQALALGCALRLAVVPSLSICLGLFLSGLMSDYLFAERAAVALWARMIYILMPNWQHFWMADALTAGGTIPWSYVARAALYAGAWTCAVLAISVGSFDRMEVKA